MATKKTAKKAAKKAAKKPAKKPVKKPAKKAAKKTADKKPEAAGKEAAEKTSPSEQAAPSVELIGLDELAELLKLPAARVRKMLRGGQIRGVKVDGEWRFNPKLVQQTLGRRSRGR